MSKAPYYWTAIPVCIDNFSYYFVVRLCTALLERKESPRMKRLLKSILCLTLLSAMLVAQENDKKTTASSGLPPVIDRELIFGNPEIAAAELSPDGKYVAFLRPWKDTRNVYVKGVNEP